MRLGVLGLIVSVALLGGASFAQERPPLPVETIQIDTTTGKKIFTVEVAADVISQQRGLMYRRLLASNAGMLFEFHEEARVAFWMKNTPLPLDMLFIRGDGTVASVQANATPYSVDTIPSGEPVRAVLEINGGQADALGIKPGDKVRAAIFRDAE
jgi:uncharacterized membrane protein (UPF0127 family)